MFKLIAVAASLLIATPAIAADKGGDDYVFSTKEISAFNLKVEIREYPSFEALGAVWASQNGGKFPADRQLIAFSQASPYVKGERRLCIIHMVDPKVSYKPEFIGHELAHCIYGDWHPVEYKK